MGRKLKIWISSLITVFIIAILMGCSGASGGQSANLAQGLQWSTLAGTLAHGNLDLYTPATRSPTNFDFSTPVPPPIHDLDAPMSTVLSDDFSDPESGWDVSTDGYGSSYYSRGGYAIQAIQKGCYSWRTVGLDVADIRIDVDATVHETNPIKDDGFGVDCRIQENGDGVAFRISSDGYIKVSLYVDLEGTDLVPWETSSAVFTDGRANHLTAICDGNQFIFLVNDIQVAYVVEDTFPSGDVALSVVSSEPEPVTVIFDNFVVREFVDN